MSEYYDEYLRSDQWKTVSSERRKMDEYKCVCCGDTDGLNVHHLYYPSDVYETNTDGLVTLCKNCHVMVHRIQEAIDKYKFTTTKSGRIDHNCSAYEKIRFDISRIAVVELWRRNMFKTRDVSSFLKAIEMVYNYNRAFVPTDMTVIMPMIATVKDCLIANKSPKFDEVKRKNKRLSKTRYK